MEMEIEKIRETIEQRTGIPASLLTGQTAEENITQARNLYEFRKKNETEKPKSGQDRFADWLRSAQGIETNDEVSTALDEIAENVRVGSGGYPIVPDGGDYPVNQIDVRTPQQMFAEYIREVSSPLNPFD